jgi:hypothetical protein
MPRSLKCEVCGGEHNGRESILLCPACRDAGILWAAKQAHAAANPPAVECVHDWLQVRGGRVCHKCNKQTSE